jgi:hypothetical protein
MVETAADKPLPMRDGNPPLFEGGLMLLAATVIEAR